MSICFYELENNQIITKCYTHEELSIIENKMRLTPPPKFKKQNRVINESHFYRCLKCGSSAEKSGIFGLFGQILCDNKKCKNSKKRFKIL